MIIDGIVGDFQIVNLHQFLIEIAQEMEAASDSRAGEILVARAIRLLAERLKRMGVTRALQKVQS